MRNRARYCVPSPIVTVHVPDGSLRFGLRREVLLPLPLVEELLGEEVAVAVALGVEAGARVAVPVPGAADAPARLEQLHREPGLTGAVQLVDAGDAGAHDQHVDEQWGAVPSVSLFCTDR